MIGTQFSLGTMLHNDYKRDIKKKNKRSLLVYICPFNELLVVVVEYYSILADLYKFCFGYKLFFMFQCTFVYSQSLPILTFYILSLLKNGFRAPIENVLNLNSLLTNDIFSEPWQCLHCFNSGCRSNFDADLKMVWIVSLRNKYSIIYGYNCLHHVRQRFSYMKKIQQCSLMNKWYGLFCRRTNTPLVMQRQSRDAE